MDAAASVSVFATVVDLVGVLAWPAVVLFVLVRFGSSIGAFLSEVGEFTLKAGSVEASAKRARAAAALGAAGTKGDAGDAADAGAIADVVAHATRPRAARRLHGSTVLWVDDHPDGNRFEREALGAVGVRVVLSPSTDDALATLAARPVDAVVSDMGRQSDSRAGYALLDALRAQGADIPVFFYSADGGAPAHRAEARRHGAQGSTGRPDELFEMVTGALGA